MGLVKCGLKSSENIDIELKREMKKREGVGLCVKEINLISEKKRFKRKEIDLGLRSGGDCMRS